LNVFVVVILLGLSDQPCLSSKQGCSRGQWWIIGVHLGVWIYSLCVYSFNRNPTPPQDLDTSLETSPYKGPW